jgi:integrase
MRKSEILSLKWGQIRNGQIYVTGKGAKPRQIPINDDLKALFKEIRKREGLRSKHVFTYQGKPIADNVKNGFKSALKKADIVNFRFHDLRHTFASHFVMRGDDLKTLQEILGHSNIATTMRYAHLSKANKAKAINLVCGLTSGKKSAMSQIRKIRPLLTKAKGFKHVTVNSF